MNGQMCWIGKVETNGQQILHLRLQANHPWHPYTNFPQYLVPNYKDFSNGSQGWATFQKLLKAGWTVVPSAKAYETTFMHDNRERMVS